MALDQAYAAQQLYHSGDQTRARFGKDVEAATSYYAELVKFVGRVAPARPMDEPRELLDVGCGCGWSSYCLSKAGFRTTGVDLNPSAFEPPLDAMLNLRMGNALALPFEASSFDVIVSYQCLEHVPNPEAALNEMLRVCRPNGIVCIVGPNLLSPLLPIKFMVNELVRGKLALRRYPQTPRHPYGNTAPEHIAKLFSVTGMLMRKLASSSFFFTMRVPDSIPPFTADNDACYVCNPADMIRFFQRHGLRILQNGRHGRPPLSYLFAGGTWVAAQRRPM